MRIRNRVGAVSATVILAIILSLAATALTACTPTPGGVIVPALWADSASGNSGIERARVTVVESKEPGFSVNLTDVRNKGGRPAWLAASASAAVVGTLFAGTNPANNDISFDITGPIDGPSAGAILTVGVLAGITRTSLLRHVTMTGTISPDGSIGQVAYIDLKLKAAQREGFTTVLLPAANKTITDSATKANVNAEEFARQLGITVHFVYDVTDAYREFTGKELVQQTAKPLSASDSPSSLIAQQRAAESVMQLARNAVAQFPVADRATWNQRLVLADQALSRSALALAYGVGLDVLQEAERVRGESQTRARLEATSAADVRQELVAKITALELVSNKSIDVIAENGINGSESQLFSLPSALSWGTYARSMLSGVRTRLESTQPIGSRRHDENEVLALLGGIIEEHRTDIEVALPQSAAIVTALPADSPRLAANPVEYLSGYTNFLVNAGMANVKYLEDVMGASLDDLAGQEPISILPAIKVLVDQANAIPLKPGSAAEELEQSALAMTLYVVTSAAVSALQTLGSDVLALDDRPIRGDYENITQAIDAGAELTEDYSLQIAQRGYQPGYMLWSKNWALGLFESYPKQRLTTDTVNLAFGEIWYDMISIMMLSSFTTSEPIKN